MATIRRRNKTYQVQVRRRGLHQSRTFNNFEEAKKWAIFTENKLNLGVGYQPHPMVSIGLSLKYLNRDFILDGTSYGKSSGLGYDAGILVQPLKNLRLGASLFDIGGTDAQNAGVISVG